jgi:hypothetical protein
MLSYSINLNEELIFEFYRYIVLNRYIFKFYKFSARLTLELPLQLWMKINTILKYLVKLNHTFILYGSHSKTEVVPQFFKSNLQLLFRVLLSLTFLSPILLIN